jgi:outer membrane protein, multidrug efflux system
MKRLAFLLALATPVAAKTVAPKVTLPAAYEVAGAEEFDLDRWWATFKDPALDKLEDEALAAGPDGRTLAARILEARATHTSQVFQTLPSGSIAGTASRKRSEQIGGPSEQLIPVGGTTDTLSANFNVSWELDLFGRLNTARKVANADMAAARFNIEGARAALAAAVADDYFQAQGLKVQLADARETVRIETELAGVSQRKADLGLGPRDEADRVYGQLAQAQAQADDLEAQLHTVQRQLLILVGRGADPVDTLNVSDQSVEIPVAPLATPSSLLLRRPDIREAEARLRSELGTAHLRHLAIFPTITLLPGLGLSRTSSPGVSFIPPATLLPQQQTTGLGFWNLAANATAPTLDIPKLLYQAKAEDARARQSAIAYEKTVQTAFGEADSALVNLTAGRKALSVLVDGEGRAHRAYEAARKRYAMGLDDLTTALSAETSWRGTRSALTSERVQVLRRAVVTYKALGGGWAYEALTPAGAGK